MYLMYYDAADGTRTYTLEVSGRLTPNLLLNAALHDDAHSRQGQAEG